MNPAQYIKMNELWDLERLKQHAQHNNVYVIQSPKFPDVVMLHYMDAVSMITSGQPLTECVVD